MFRKSLEQRQADVILTRDQMEIADDSLVYAFQMHDEGHWSWADCEAAQRRYDEAKAAYRLAVRSLGRKIAATKFARIRREYFQGQATRSEYRDAAGELDRADAAYREAL